MIDREMASFRAITAEEEAATANEEVVDVVADPNAVDMEEEVELPADSDSDAEVEVNVDDENLSIEVVTPEEGETSAEQQQVPVE